MPFVDLGKEFKNAKETPLAPEGPHDLIIKDYHYDDKKKYYRVRVDFEGEEFRPITHWLNLPQPEKDAKNDEEKGHDPGTTSRTKALFLKRFLHLFSVPYTDTGFNDADLKGARARADVTQVMNENMKRRENNIVLPELPEEGSTATATESKAPQPRRRAS